jgi:DNA primase
MNVLDLAQRKVKLRRVSNTNGGEYQGPCPACGGDDRFHVWPRQSKDGSYWCRQCGKAGDNIQFLRDFEGMTFKEACGFLTIDISQRSDQVTPSQPGRKKPEFEPNRYAPPPDLWCERAEKLVTRSRENLMKNTAALEWLDERGITQDMAETYHLGWNPGENGRDIYRARKAWGLPEFRKPDGRLKALWIPVGLVIPTIINGAIIRIRIRRPEGKPRYYVIPGSSSHTMLLEEDRQAFVVVESELDAIAVAAGNTLAGSIAVGTSHGKPDDCTFEILKRSLQILVSLDFDKAGANAMEWWREHFDRCDRWPVPVGKDPGDAFRMGMDLEQWIKTGLPPVMKLKERETGARNHGTHPVKSGMTVLSQEANSTEQIPASVYELETLLRKNPAVTIINTERRYTVLRNGKYVGGRINRLVFSKDVREYIFSHSAEEITGENLIMKNDEKDT